MVLTRLLLIQLQKLTQSGKTQLKDLAGIDIQVAHFFADAVDTLLKNANILATDIKVIGSHGQTIFHQGGEYSMQIGHGAIIARCAVNAYVSSAFITRQRGCGN